MATSYRQRNDSELEWQRAYSERRRSNHKRPCPVCDDRKGKCLFIEGKIAWCHYDQSGKEAPGTAVPSYIHWLSEWRPWNTEGYTGTTTFVRPVKPVAEPVTVLTPEKADEVYRQFLKLCPLKAEHAIYLQKEGIDTAGCGSFERAKSRYIAAGLVNQYGEMVARRHPLLKLETGNRGVQYWTIAAWQDGIIFPALNERSGLIAGCQLRADQPTTRADRYKWISHEGLVGTPLTVFVAPVGERLSDTLIITEGYKKAALARNKWGANTISLAGVNSYKLADLLTEINALGITHVAVAFDSDKVNKAQVRKAEQKLLSDLAVALPDCQIQILSWPAAWGKGLDDAIKAGCQEFGLENFTFEPGRRFVDGLPAQALQKAFGKAVQPLYTLDEARLKNGQVARRIIYSSYPQHATNISPTGTGKSHNTDAQVVAAALDKNFTKTITKKGKNGKAKSKVVARRILVLGPNKENILERAAPGSQAHKLIRRKKATIQFGRNIIEEIPEPGQATDFDCLNPQALDAGLNRHSTRIVCENCPFSGRANWLKAHPEDADPNDEEADPRPWRCEKEGYLASRKRSERAQVVYATKEAFLNGSNQLSKFDVVINDEDLMPYLVEQIKIDAGVIREWREKTKFLETVKEPLDQESDWLELFSVLEGTLAELPSVYGGDKAFPFSLLPVAEIIERVAERVTGYALTDLLEELPQEASLFGEREEGFGFETPYRPRFINGQYNAAGKLRIPLRAGEDLVKALRQGDRAIKAVRNPDGSFTLLITQIREHLVDTLRGQSLLNLDATVPPALKKLFPRMQEFKFDVPQHVVITQITNALYTSRDLEKEETRQRVERVIEKFQAGAEKPLVIIPKKYRADLTDKAEDAKTMLLPEGTLAEHWGKHKATNQYSGCDNLVLVGHYERPIDYVRAEIDAVRCFIKEADPTAKIAEKLRLYNHLGQDGTVAGRWCKSDPDPDVQEAVEHDYAANIIQAIGRLRGALRDADKPAQVLIACAEPVGDLAIDELVTAHGITQSVGDWEYPCKINTISHVYTCENEQKSQGYSDEELIPNFTGPRSQFATRLGRFADDLGRATTQSGIIDILIEVSRGIDRASAEYDFLVNQLAPYYTLTLRQKAGN